MVSCPTVSAVNLGPLEEQGDSLTSGHLFFFLRQGDFELIIQLRLALNFETPNTTTALINTST